MILKRQVHVYVSVFNRELIPLNGPRVAYTSLEGLTSGCYDSKQRGVVSPGSNLSYIQKPGFEFSNIHEISQVGFPPVPKEWYFIGFVDSVSVNISSLTITESETLVLKSLQFF